MTEAEVEERLGPPTERRSRPELGPWPSSSQGSWAFGVLQPGGFAFGGIVFFDETHRVTEVHSPIRDAWLHPPNIPWSEVPIGKEGGVTCHLEALAPEPLGIRGEITLKNLGTVDIRRRQPVLPVAFDVVVELFDSDKVLVARGSLTSSFSPYSSDDEAELVIPSGGSIRERVYLGFESESYFGTPPPGIYWVRAVFPLGADVFSASEPVRIEITERPSTAPSAGERE